MNRQDLEHRLRHDAERLQTECPPHLRHRVAARLRDGEQQTIRRQAALPALAGALGVLAVFATVWMLWQPAGVEQAPRGVAGLNAAPIVASSDRLLASREAALEFERQLLERDLRNLRDHVTATFDRNPNG